jgi:hypothetical protein
MPDIKTGPLGWHTITLSYQYCTLIKTLYHNFKDFLECKVLFKGTPINICLSFTFLYTENNKNEILKEWYSLQPLFYLANIFTGMIFWKLLKYQSIFWILYTDIWQNKLYLQQVLLTLWAGWHTHRFRIHVFMI